MCATYCVPMSEDEILRIAEEISESKRHEERQISFEHEGAKARRQRDYIVRPTEYAPVLTAAGYRKMRFGFRVGYSTAPLFNARSESVHIKKTFASHYAERRCLIPAAYYMEKGRKFCLPGEKVMFLAGVYRESGDGQLEYVILTRDSSDAAEVRPIHGRMPVIIPERMRRAWLDEGLGIDDAVVDVRVR